MGDLTLRVITPDSIVLDTQVTAIKVPATDGSMGILPRHAHMVAALDVGELTYTAAAGGEESLFVSGGFVEVRANTVRVVCEASELPMQIDEARATGAEERARKRLDEGRRGTVAGFDILRAEFALKRARFRLRSSRRRV